MPLHTGLKGSLQSIARLCFLINFLLLQLNITFVHANIKSKSIAQIGSKYSYCEAIFVDSQPCPTLDKWPSRYRDAVNLSHDMAFVVAGLSRLCQVGTTTTTTTTTTTRTRNRECSIYFQSFPNSMDSTMTLNVFAASLWLWLGDLDLNNFVKIDLAWLRIIATISTPTVNKVHRSRRAQWSKCSCILRRSKLMYGVDLPTFVLSKRILGPLITKLQPVSTPCPPDPRSGQQQHHGSKDSATACFWKDPNWTGGNP